eukprot:10103541-Alexandrium_andersonii.AAC.1
MVSPAWVISSRGSCELQAVRRIGLMAMTPPCDANVAQVCWTRTRGRAARSKRSRGGLSRKMRGAQAHERAARTGGLHAVE